MRTYDLLDRSIQSTMTSLLGASLLLGGCFSPDPSRPGGNEGSSSVGSSDGSDGPEDTTAGTGDGPPDDCGNGVLDEGEECDLGDGNVDNGGCTSECRLGVCGDGLLYIGQEDCDDGAETATCNADCTTASCGDGVLNATAGETCDDGGDSASCNADCSAASCGDGILNAAAGETCDAGTGNAESGACLPSCQAASCGDGFVQAGVEECDGDPANGTCDACLLTCTPDFDDCNGDTADGCELQLCGGTCDAPGSVTGMVVFDYTGMEQQLVIPGCVSTVTIEALGASGGSTAIGPGLGGLGGQATGELMVSPGDVLYVYVGQHGADSSGGDAGVPGSFNGGGSGGTSIGGATQPGGAAGGGASDVRFGGTALGDRILVAAGGGGSGGGTQSYATDGGAGGGLTGGPGLSYISGIGFEAQGGTQAAGGAAGSYAYGVMATPGALGLGGDGAGEGYSGGGGGGGGYYGGGGGSCHFESGGGGGSSYVGGVVNGMTNAGDHSGDGQVVISW